MQPSIRRVSSDTPAGDGCLRKAATGTFSAEEHGNQRRYRHLPNELSNRGNRHFIISLHTFPPPPTKYPAQKNCAGQQDIKSEQYSFVCVLRADRLPGPDNPMQSLRRRARFPRQLPLPQESLAFFTVKNPHVPDVPIQFPDQGHGRPASYFQGRSFHPPQRCLRSHLPKTRITTGARRSRDLCCSPSLLRLTWRSPRRYLGSVIAIMVGD